MADSFKLQNYQTQQDSLLYSWISFFRLFLWLLVVIVFASVSRHKCSFLSHLSSTQPYQVLTKLNFVAPVTSKMVAWKLRLRVTSCCYIKVSLVLWFHSCLPVFACLHRAPAEGDCDEAVQSTRFPPAAAGRWNHWWDEGGRQWLQ